MAGIFKAYDIRGIVGEGVTPDVAYLIGRGLAATLFAEGGRVVITRDMRDHGRDLSTELARGLSEGGCDVLNCGLAATPMNYWAINHFDAAGGVSVTASHNGPRYNGFKVSGRGASPYSHDNGLDRVEQWVRDAEAGRIPEAPGGGSIEQVEGLLDPYLAWMRGFLKPASGSPRRLKIAVDAGNGMGGHFLPGFLEGLDWIEAVPLFWELDGEFPNHEADPLKPENLAWAQDAVRSGRCDLGVALDGDADRCMFIDETGEPISSDLTTALLAAHILQRFPGSPILYDLRSSHVVPQWISGHGGEPVRGRVGHSFMKRLMREKKACFGGELSGHYYFAECFQTDSGLMALIEMINLLQSDPAPLSELVAPLRQFSATGEINYRVPDTRKAIQQIEDEFRGRAQSLDHLDGLTVEMDGWWFNLRSSNTEPLLRLNLEAPSDAERDKHRAELEQVLGVSPVSGH